MLAWERTPTSIITEDERGNIVGGGLEFFLGDVRRSILDFNWNDEGINSQDFIMDNQIAVSTNEKILQILYSPSQSFEAFKMMSSIQSDKFGVLQNSEASSKMANGMASNEEVIVPQALPSSSPFSSISGMVSGLPSLRSAPP